MAAGYFQGGTYGPGDTFDEGNVFEGVTFIAPVTFAEGNIFINVTFECYRECKKGPCGCCPEVSTVGPGSVSVNSSGDHVEFEATGTAHNFTDTGCTLLTLPGCVDCAGDAHGGAAVTTGTEVVVTDRGTLTYEEWCRKAGMNGVVAEPMHADVATTSPPCA